MNFKIECGGCEWYFGDEELSILEALVTETTSMRFREVVEKFKSREYSQVNLYVSLDEEEKQLLEKMTDVRAVTLILMENASH